MTADTPAPRATTVPLFATGALLESMSPTLTGIMGQPFINVTQSIGAIVLKEIDLSGISKLIAGMTQTPSFSKMIAEQYASVGAIGQALASIHKVQFESMYQNVDLQKAMTAFSGSFTQSVSSQNVNALLSQATSLQSILEDKPDVDEFAKEFFEEQPELAQSIEQMPFLIALSSTDRKLIIWFFTVVVAIYVTVGIIDITLDNPALGLTLGALGLSGPGVGKQAAKATKKLLDRIPPTED